ncbi:MAG TPA: hypothetical protein GXX36_16565 [Clostridiaceae bacterium]|nr:hypothetical protein [Clostridiaceae bacterium]
MTRRKKALLKKLMAFILATIIVVSVNIGSLNVFAASGLLKPMLIVDMTEKTGDILHGAAGFLYGVSSENVPTTNTLTPLKPKVLATKGALGTEHPYGDALDVAETFLEAGGEQVQMYNSNYYAVFGPTAHPEDYADVLENIIAPKVKEWEEKDPEYRKGKLVYVPINEGTPAGQGYSFNQAFKLYYDAIKRAHPDALVAGPNDANFSSNTIYNFLVYAKNNNCIPDVITWHELDNSDIPNIYNNVQRVRNWMRELNIPDRKIVINEYAPAVDCGVPGKLVNWIARLEDAKVYGCLPFWHQANNLNDLAADANVGNGAWWVYKWYGDMSGQTLKVEAKNTTYDGLYGLASIDDNKKITNVIFGGVDGDATIILNKIDETIPFNGAEKVHVKIEAAYFSGFHGAVNEPDTILEGTFPVKNGRLIIDMKDMVFSTGYKITVTAAREDEEVDNPRIGKFRAVYEAEKAELSGNASVSGMGWYYASGKQYVRNINNDGDGLVYTINVPTDGKYKLEFVYANGEGANSQSETLHNPLNLTQTLSIDGNEPIVMNMKSTLLSEMTGIHTEYVDLTAGEHTLTIKKHGSRGGVNHDVLYVTYAGAYQQSIPEFNKIYEAELADFNTLGNTTHTNVTTRTDLPGYSKNGYVTGLNESPVENGGGIRWNVVVEESGLYDIILRYQSTTDGEARIYLDNTNLTFNNLCTTASIVNTNGEWAYTRATIYLQTGINIIDVDTSVNAAVDYMRVKKARGLEDRTITIEAENAELHGTEAVESTYASNGKYIKGLEGDANAIENGKYIEFKVNVDEAGPYKMQVFFSNKDIFGTHAYNLKIIDKYASIQVNDQEPKRYFFINTFSNDTFKEKTITVNLEQGENTIKIFNDDSWQVTKGDRRDQPGDIPLDNYSPNFDKFLFTPAVIDATSSEKEDYKVDIFTSAGGTAIADKNVVEPEDTVELTIVPEKGIKDVLVNGESYKNSLIDNQDGTYTLIISNVQSDIEVFVNFESISGDGIGENEDIYIKNSSFGTGDTTDWEIEIEGGIAVVEDGILNLAAGNYYLKLSGEEDWRATISQQLNNVPDGKYILSVYSKNVDGEIPDAEPGEVNEYYLFADNGQRIFKENIGIFDDYSQTSMWVEVIGGELTVGVSVDAKAGLDVYLDHFALKQAPIDESIAYFVNAGDIDPKTINEGDKYGIYNTVTDQFYGPDKITGMKWGVVDQYVPRSSYPGYLTGQYTWPAENIGASDSSPKEETYRYARDQHTMDRITRPGVQYKFELPNGTYRVEIAMQNSWSSNWNVDVWFNWGTEYEEKIASNVKLPNGRTASTIAKVIKEAVVENGELSIRVNGVQQDAPGVISYIIIKPLSLEKTLESIEVTPPVKTEYIVGEVFDARGMSVTAKYSDGSSEIVTDYTISGFDSATPGEKTITVTYQGKTATFKVNVFPLTSDRSFIIISDGELDRTNGILAVVYVAPVQGGPAHDGAEVVLFQLMRGNTPVSIVALEKDIIVEENLRAYFNVDPNDDSYKVRVYVLDSFTTDLTSAPVSLAEWITLQ